MNTHQAAAIDAVIEILCAAGIQASLCEMYCTNGLFIWLPGVQPERDKEIRRQNDRETGNLLP